MTPGSVTSLSWEDRRAAEILVADRSLPSAGGCLEWIGQIKDQGHARYGKIDARIGGRRRTLIAHRLAYLVHSDIPPQLAIDHLCYNTLCVNPLHLEAVTAAENNRRRRRVGRHREAFAGGSCPRCGSLYEPYIHNQNHREYHGCPNRAKRWHRKTA